MEWQKECLGWRDLLLLNILSFIVTYVFVVNPDYWLMTVTLLFVSFTAVGLSKWFLAKLLIILSAHIVEKHFLVLAFKEECLTKSSFLYVLL